MSLAVIQESMNRTKPELKLAEAVKPISAISDQIKEIGKQLQQGVDVVCKQSIGETLGRKLPHHGVIYVVNRVNS